MSPKKKKITFVLLLFFSLFAAFYLVRLPEICENRKIESVFNHFEKAYNLGQYPEAYSLMSPRYREIHNIDDFKHLFGKIEPLKSDWDVVRQFGKVHICCNDAGVSFSPNSTMTYIIEKVEGKWYLTGEWERFLD